MMDGWFQIFDSNSNPVAQSYFSDPMIGQAGFTGNAVPTSGYQARNRSPGNDQWVIKVCDGTYPKKC